MSRVFFSEIVPGRITEAREARQYNIAQLADAINVTRQAVWKYEQGEALPSETNLQKIIKVLDFPYEFFFKPIECSNIADGVVFYRSLKSSEASARSMIKVKCGWIGEVYLYLNEYLKMPVLNLPQLDLLVNKNELRDEEIEELANIIRRHWSIGIQPIDNLTYLAEKNGFVVSSVETTCQKTDGCSEYIKGIPVIFLDKGLKSACRSRFSLAHEIAHLIMHGHITKDDIKDKKVLNRIEHEADRFAGAFLMPRDSFARDIRSVSLDYFLSIKRKWRVSIAAMIYRCKDLGLLDEEQVLMLRKQISYRRWIREEPLDREIPLERPSLIRSATKLLFDEQIVSPLEFVNVFRWPISDLSDICACDESFFTKEYEYQKPYLSLR